mmetsp:Transcript_64212/g.144947  ORF Transcript_64212/g.144947 Transcript_64212/m.144947 type:complete len:231 (+) Transcript_64212:137-829(+)
MRPCQFPSPHGMSTSTLILYFGIHLPRHSTVSCSPSSPSGETSSCPTSGESSALQQQRSMARIASSTSGPDMGRNTSFWASGLVGVSGLSTDNVSKQLLTRPAGSCFVSPARTLCMWMQCSLSLLPQLMARDTARRAANLAAQGGQSPPMSICWQQTSSTPGSSSGFSVMGRKRYADRFNLARKRSSGIGLLCPSMDFMTTALAPPSSSGNRHLRITTSRSQKGQGSLIR